VERKSRLVKLIHLPRPDSFELRDGLLRELVGLPPELLRSITWDQGSEMARHLEIAAATCQPKRENLQTPQFCEMRPRSETIDKRSPLGSAS
jgi:hypothetical protein